MRLLLVGAQYSRRNTNLTQSEVYAVSKGYEVLLVNGFRTEKNWTGKSDYIYFNKINPLVKFAIEMEVDKVICISLQNSMLRDAKLKEELEEQGIEVITNSLEVVETFMDKCKTRTFLERLGVNMARGKNLPLGSNQDYIESEIIKIGLPVAVKEAISSGGLGVKIIDNEQEINEFIHNYEPTKEYVIEKYIDGIELSMEVLCFKGKYQFNPLIYKGETQKGKHSLDKIRISPFNHSNVSKAAKEVVKKVADTINPCGIIEIDMIWSYKTNMLYVLEINPRMGGISRLDMEATKVNIPQILVDMADDSWIPTEFILESKITVELPLAASVKDSDLKFAERLNSMKWYIDRPRGNSQGMICFSGQEEQVLLDVNDFSHYLLHTADDVKETIERCTDRETRIS